MKPKTIVVIGADKAAQIAAKRAQETNWKARIEIIEKSSLDDITLDMDASSVTVRSQAGVERIRFDSLIFCGGIQGRSSDIPGLEEVSGSVSPLDSTGGSHRAVVIGCGREGIALSQQLRSDGFSVSILEKSARIFPRFSFETSQKIILALRALQIEVHLQEEIVEGEKLSNGAFRLFASSKRVFEADKVVVATGTVANVQLLAQAGAMIAQDGTVFVDESMKTTLDSVYACGEAVSLLKAISQARQYRPSASMIERSAHVAGANAASENREKLERMVPCAGTEFIEVGEQLFGRTGLSPSELHQLFPKGDFVRATVTIQNQMTRLWAAVSSGAIIGGEVTGDRASLRNLDAISFAVARQLKPDDLLNLDVSSELREAAEHLQSALRKETESISSEKVALWLAEQRPFHWVDVGETPTPMAKHFKGSTHVPLERLSKNLTKLPDDVPLIVASPSGRSAYQACRILKEQRKAQMFHLEGGSQMLAFYGLELLSDK